MFFSEMQGIFSYYLPILFFLVIVKAGNLDNDGILAKKKIIFDWNHDKNTFNFCEIHFHRIGVFRFAQQLTDGKLQYVVKGKPMVNNAQLADMIVVEFDKSGQIKFNLVMNNPMMKQLGGIVHYNKMNMLKNLEHVYVTTLERFFREFVELDKQAFMKLKPLLKDAVKEYFSTLKCNGKDIHKKIYYWEIKSKFH